MSPSLKTTLYSLALFLCAWFFLGFLLPLTSPFLLGALLALAAEPVVAVLSKRLHVPRAVSSGIGVTMVFALLALMLLALCAFLVRELGQLAGILPDLTQTAQSGADLLEHWLLDLASHTPKSIRPLVSEQVSSLFSDGASLVDKVLRYILGLAGNLLSHIPDSALGLGTAVISGFMISVKLPRFRRWLLRRLPRERLRSLLATLSRIKKTILAFLLAQCKLMGVTFCILALGLLILRVPYALLWAMAVSLIDALPVLGTGTVLLPWALVCFLQGTGGQAVGLIGIYVLITLTRSILEPRFLGRHLGLDPLLTLMALYAGYQLWGIGGMLLAPLLAVTAIQLVPQKG